MPQPLRFWPALVLALVLLGSAWAASASPAMAHLAFACDRTTCRSVTVPAGAVTGGGLFRAGALDLTGDGVPDAVRLAGGRVTVAGSDGSAWLSQPEWNVVDAALGDPNDDGRGEIMVAFWKRDVAGAPRSQPFIVGYRGGLYRPLWGGSPVVDPIQEVELGDVDGDGAQDLVVLDAVGGRTAVSVWRWHGWGFTLLWRSAPGAYRDLALVAGSPATIVVLGTCDLDPATVCR